MAHRLRISTTVDADNLASARSLVGKQDSEVIDQALRALIHNLERERELAALQEHPYELDPDLNWEPPAGPPLPYDAEIPAEVLALAEERRKQGN
jgi:hypothetical protein